jgi:hypothetical protein
MGVFGFWRIRTAKMVDRKKRMFEGPENLSLVTPSRVELRVRRDDHLKEPLQLFVARHREFSCKRNSCDSNH